MGREGDEPWVLLALNSTIDQFIRLLFLYVIFHVFTVPFPPNIRMSKKTGTPSFCRTTTNVLASCYPYLVLLEDNSGVKFTIWMSGKRLHVLATSIRRLRVLSFPSP